MRPTAVGSVIGVLPKPRISPWGTTPHATVQAGAIAHAARAALTVVQRAADLDNAGDRYRAAEAAYKAAAIRSLQAATIAHTAKTDITAQAALRAAQAATEGYQQVWARRFEGWKAEEAYDKALREVG